MSNTVTMQNIQGCLKSLIIHALDTAYINLDNQVPETKTDVKSLDVGDVNPLELPNFMKANRVPDSAYFDSTPNDYDAYKGDIKLSWKSSVPTTEEDKINYKRKRFARVAWSYVYELLVKKNGYIRQGYNSGLLKEFSDTTVYDMYMQKDFDRLVKYYSLPFKK